MTPAERKLLNEKVSLEQSLNRADVKNDPAKVRAIRATIKAIEGKLPGS